jgi:hypothetical protein
MQVTTEKFISYKGDYMKNALETIDYKGFKIGIFQDTDAETPRDWDNIGTMFCKHSRYELGDKDAESPFIEDEETGKYKLREDIAIALPLYLIDHSGIAMRTHNYKDVDPGEWDSGQVGVIYVTKEKVKAEYGDREDALETAKSCLIGEVKTFSDFIEGNVYGYIVEDSEGNHIASCWGFYPDEVKGQWSREAELESLLSEAKNAVENELEEAKEAESIQAL